MVCLASNQARLLASDRHFDEITVGHQCQLSAISGQLSGGGSSTSS
jgi:hypothetical protein